MTLLDRVLTTQWLERICAEVDRLGDGHAWSDWRTHEAWSTRLVRGATLGDLIAANARVYGVRGFVPLSGIVEDVA